MRDLNYLNLIYEDLDEGIGIKTTKLKPFYDSAVHYESQRNPNTKHSELKKPARRKIRYDYGKATYDLISAQDAIQLVKQDKYNVQKLRIIYDINKKNSLVEYEVRDNGSIYAIYGSGDPVVIDGKSYKNIRYAPWKKVLEAADLIYVTDEYDRYLDADPEKAQARSDRNKFSQLPLVADKSSPDFDPHKVYANAYQAGSTASYGFPARYAPHNVDTGAHKIMDRYDPTVANTIKPYIEAQNTVRELYQQSDRYRRALRKLETDKDFLDAEEYDRKYNRWSTAYENSMNKYHEAIAELKKIEAKVDKSIDAQSAEFAEKLRLNIYEYDNAITRGFNLSNKIRNLKAKLTGDLANNTDISRELRDAANQVKHAAEAIQQCKAALEQILANMDDEEAIQNAQSDVLAAASIFDTRLRKVEALKLQELRKHLDQIDEVAEQLKDVDVELAKLRPKAAAAKAARAAKNRTPELDPELVDIIDFVDFDDDTSDN